jgi:hypothetical protein
MKDKGHRETHIARDLPYVLFFVERVDEEHRRMMEFLNSRAWRDSQTIHNDLGHQ